MADGSTIYKIRRVLSTSKHRPLVMGRAGISPMRLPTVTVASNRRGVPHGRSAHRPSGGNRRRTVSGLRDGRPAAQNAPPPSVSPRPPLGDTIVYTPPSSTYCLWMG